MHKYFLIEKKKQHGQQICSAIKTRITKHKRHQKTKKPRHYANNARVTIVQKSKRNLRPTSHDLCRTINRSAEITGRVCDRYSFAVRKIVANWRWRLGMCPVTSVSDGFPRFSFPGSALNLISPII